MQRIIWHWTAGAYGLNALEADHYHFVVDQDGRATAGVYTPEDNAGPLVAGKYAAHTRAANTGAIGVAVDAMAGAKDRPLETGDYPITPAQLDGLVALTATLALKYSIPVTRQTVLSHAEVQPTLGIKQAGKWDIAWLPGMAAVGDPVQIGDTLRARVQAAIDARLRDEAAAGVPARGGFPAWLAALIAAVFGGRK